MLSLTEDKIPVPLVPDTELSDVRIGATDPALFFSINILSPCCVTIEFQEFNSASRCVLQLSPTDPHPSKHTASWSYLSPDPFKIVKILPADPSYQVGQLYLAVRYVEPGGSSFIRLKLTLQERYQAEWYSAANCAFYSGSWFGYSYDGRGRCIYGVTSEEVKNDVNWEEGSTQIATLLDFYESKAERPFNPTEEEIAKHDLGWSILPLPFHEVEMYSGEWVNGKKEGLGVFQWKDKAYWGMWKAGLREGFGVMSTQNGFRYHGKWLNDKKHGRGKGLYPDGVEYLGEWENDMRSGPGILTLTNGVVVRGTWHENVLSVQVTAEYPDGSFYSGEWGFNCCHGMGCYRDSLGNVFEGTWEMNKRTGNGKLTFANGVMCVATWENDERQGGTFTFPNGEVYIGDWDENLYVREGKGRCIYPGGDEYEGSWHEDFRHGIGRFIQSSKKCVYEGEWKKGKREGIGMQKTEDGTYHGEFKNDARCGHGIHLGRSGSMYSGCWKENNRIGHGVYFDSSSESIHDGLFLHGKPMALIKSRSREDIYDGSCLDGHRQGWGLSLLPNGDEVQQFWHRGIPHDGYVLRKYADGSMYKGDWSNGRRCGTGTQWYADGSVYEGEWWDNVHHGHGSLKDVRGDCVEGKWCNGTLMDGAGRIRFVDGSEYEGDMSAGVPHGRGRLRYPDGTNFEGIFRNGIYMV